MKLSAPSSTKLRCNTFIRTAIPTISRIPRPTSNCTCRRKWWATARNTLCRTSPCRLPFMNRAPLTSFCPPPWTLKWLRPNRALKVDRPRTLKACQARNRPDSASASIYFGRRHHPRGYCRRNLSGTSEIAGSPNGSGDSLKRNLTFGLERQPLRRHSIDRFMPGRQPTSFDGLDVFPFDQVAQSDGLRRDLDLAVVEILLFP